MQRWIFLSSKGYLPLLFPGVLQAVTQPEEHKRHKNAETGDSCMEIFFQRVYNIE